MCNQSWVVGIADYDACDTFGAAVGMECVGCGLGLANEILLTGGRGGGVGWVYISPLYLVFGPALFARPLSG